MDAAQGERAGFFIYHSSELEAGEEDLVGGWVGGLGEWVNGMNEWMDGWMNG